MIASLDSGGLKLFYGFNGSIEIGALICEKNIEEKFCLKNNEDFIDIYIKINAFQIIVSSMFSIRNIRFFGNDIILSDFKNNTCLRQRIVCCASLINDCSVENKILIYNDEYIENKSFLLIKSTQTDEVPKLFLTNVVFLNFYSLQKEIGWKVLIISNALSKVFHLSNIKILNFYFAQGIWLDLQFSPNEFSNTNNISIANVFFENQSFALNQDKNSKNIKIGLFTFMNSSNYLINITNITIQSISNNNNLQNYFFYFESNFEFQQNYVYINNLIFENNTDIGFLYGEGLFQIFISNFEIKNISYSKETYFFVLFNKSRILFNDGLFFMVFCSNLFLFSCEKCSEFSLNSVYITNFYGKFGFVSDSIISISNSQFESMISDYLMIISRSYFSLIKTNFSSSIFNQVAFKIFDSNNLIYNESWCMNVSTPKFFSLQSESSIYWNLANIIVYFIRILNTKSDFLFFSIEDVLLNFLILSDIEILNCSSFFLMEAKTNCLLINIFNISLVNLSFSPRFFINIDQFSNEIIDVTAINLSYFIFENCVFEGSMFSFEISSVMVMIQIDNFYFDSCNTKVLFNFQLLPDFHKYYKVNLNKIYLIHMKGDINNSGFLYLVNSIDSQINSLLISNLDVNQCSSFQILNIRIKFNIIALYNISISFIEMNNDSLITIYQIFETHDDLGSPLNSSLIIQNMKILSTHISENVERVIFIETFNIPITINFTNSYFQEIKTRFIFFLSSPLMKLISAYFFDLEFNHVKQIFSDFFLIYSRVPVSEVSISNIYIYNSYTFYIILLSHMFDNIVVKKITIIILEYVLFCIIFIFQSDSQSTEYTKVEITNINLVDIAITNDWLSPMTVLFLVNFDELIMENIMIKNMRMNNKNPAASYASGLTYFGYIEFLNIASMNRIDFRQNVWANLDQVFRIRYVFYLLEIKNSQFEISWESILIRRFQTLYVIYSLNIFFENNVLIGMSTVEKPQFKFEEIGVVAFMAEESYDLGQSAYYSIVIKSTK